MTSDKIDRVIDEQLDILKEEKYKLRTFQIQLLLKIAAIRGVEETLQDIRSIGGVTVVTALDSTYRDSSSAYFSHIRVKFHPQKDTTPPRTFIKDHLLPVIRSSEIPDTTVVRIIGVPEQVQ